MMVQSTIDKIKDTTIYRSIRKLCGVIDEQNTVVENLQNELDAFDLDGVKADVTKLKTNDAAQDTKIATVSENVATLTEDISYLKSSVSSQNSRLTNAETDILNLRDEDKKLTNALPKTYTLYRNGEGKIQAQVETIDGTLFNSNILDMIIPYQYDIISGTTERSFKLDITMSDGSKYTTNDFIIPAGGGTEVVVTGITLAKDSNNVNRFHVGINLSDGTMIDSGYISMVDNVVADFTDSKLTISVNGVSSVPVAIDVSGEFTPGTGITITSGTIAIDDTVVALKSDIADMETKTNASATYATKTALASTDANVALAQSTADDANTKANSAIDNVSISGSTMTFSKINDEHIDVEIPINGIDLSIIEMQPSLSYTSSSTGSKTTYEYESVQVGNCALSLHNSCKVLNPIYHESHSATWYSYTIDESLVLNHIKSIANLGNGIYAVAICCGRNVEWNHTHGSFSRTVTRKQMFSTRINAIIVIEDNEIIDYFFYGSEIHSKYPSLDFISVINIDKI